MIEERELVTLLTGIAVLVFMVLRRKELEHIPNNLMLLFSFAFLVAGWFFTVLEGFGLTELLNIVEHGCYSTSSLLLAIWTWKSFIARHKKQ